MFLRSARGLLDFLLALVCLWTAWHHTPAGALVRRSAAWALGSRSSARPLLAYYDAVHAAPLAATALTPSTPPSAVLGGPEALAYGTHLALRGLSPKARSPALELARQQGLSDEALFDEAQGPSSTRSLLGSLAGEFPEEEARLVALFAGPIPARYALGRVAAEGASPSLERLARHLPPGFEEATSAASQALALATAFALDWPLAASARVTSPFGVRNHPILGTRRMHTGVDLAVPSGTSVLAVAEGLVRRASEDAVNGRVLILDHGRGVTTAYCHNSELLVRSGQRVSRGQPIARSGNTGRSTGPHLHYQLELASQPVDPLRFRAQAPLVESSP